MRLQTITNFLTPPQKRPVGRPRGSKNKKNDAPARKISTRRVQIKSTPGRAVPVSQLSTPVRVAAHPSPTPSIEINSSSSSSPTSPPTSPPASPTGLSINSSVSSDNFDSFDERMIMCESDNESDGDQRERSSPTISQLLSSPPSSQPLRIDSDDDDDDDDCRHDEPPQSVASMHFPSQNNITTVSDLIDEETGLTFEQMKIRYAKEISDNFVHRADIHKLHDEIDQLKIQNSKQKSQIKTIKTKYESTSKKLSKYTGIRKYSVNQLSQQAETENDVNPNTAENESPEADQSNNVPSTRRRRRKRRSNAVAMVTSLGSGLGTRLAKQGVDCTTFKYSGAELPYMRSRVSHVISQDNPPQQIFIQGGGNDCEKHKPHEVSVEYNKLINEIKRVSPDTQILVGKIPKRHFNLNLHDRIEKVNWYLERKSDVDNSVSFVDACPDFPLHFNNSHVHFRKSGHDIYANKVACAMINFQASRSQMRG